LQQSGTVDVGRFSGNQEQDSHDFLRKYERHARALGWRADKMKVDLPWHLAGKALLDYELRFSEQGPETYAELIGYLGGSQLDGITSIPAFTGRRMKPNESVNEYYTDLVVKARRAFPGSSRHVRLPYLRSFHHQYWERRHEGILVVKRCEKHRPGY